MPSLSQDELAARDLRAKLEIVARRIAIANGLKEPIDVTIDVTMREDDRWWPALSISKRRSWWQRLVDSFTLWRLAAADVNGERA